MEQDERPQAPIIDEDAALRSVLEGTATETGTPFFEALVRNLARALGTAGAWVTEYLEDRFRLRALAFWLDGGLVDEYEYDVAGTPCEHVIKKRQLIHYPQRVIELFPNDPDLPDLHAVAYMGAPLLDVDGTVLGHLAVLDSKVMPAQERCETLFRIFAGRASAELRRIRAEQDIRAREEKFSRLVNGAMDAIIEIDRELRVSLVNPAAEKVFGVTAEMLVGDSLNPFMADQSRRALTRVMAKLDTQPEGPSHQWIPDGLTGIRQDGRRFPAEASLSFGMDRATPRYTLILRDVHDREKAREQMHSLTEEAEYLREQIEVLREEDEILGASRAMKRIREDIGRVAATDATVLIYGETGTGKELVARAMHKAGARAAKPMITVNCAAIPANLIESEFFGHEQGAFTGATARREGRFALADGGTIFLDEIGELPLELQGKLLRVLQEGEFAPVGSSSVRKVNVRVIAATNRDLKKMVNDGSFREDLFYRLNVFPITVPPLRDRENDVVLLTEKIAERIARRMGRRVPQLSEDSYRRLRSYHWPGNVRELQNVIERALINCTGKMLSLASALPQASPDGAAAIATAEPITPQDRVRTIEEMQELEKSNILLALEQCNWRVSGPKGAARILGMPSSTLSSRIKALGIRRRWK